MTPSATRASRLMVAIALLAMPLLPASAAQLYAREAPRGSAFMHFFNGTADPLAGLGIAGRQLPALAPYAAGGYVFLPPGNYAVDAGGSRQAQAFATNHFYTACATAAGLHIFEFQEPLPQLKALLGVINLMPGTTLTLRTADGKSTVFGNLAPYASMQRPVNAQRALLALYSAGRKLADVPPIVLERRQAFTLYIAGTESTPVMVWNRD